MEKSGKIAIALNMNKLNKNSFIAIICALERKWKRKIFRYGF